MTSRNVEAEIDALKERVRRIERLIESLISNRSTGHHALEDAHERPDQVPGDGAIYYSGRIRSGEEYYLWQPQQRTLEALLGFDSEKAGKVLAALGHKQRLDILRLLLDEPLNGAEIVERLNMGTTGQLYHHLKALQGADLVAQEERGGKYRIPAKRVLPMLLLLAAALDLLETSDYIDMTEVRNNAGRYLGRHSESGYDVHVLLWAVMENSILEHQAGFCTEIRVYLHRDGSATVSDNGRGMPVKVLPRTSKPFAQSVLTEVTREEHQYFVPGGEKGISIAVVNALSQKLTVEIRREGRIYRQEYVNGIPQTDLMAIGFTNDTGTSVTFKPNAELFGSRFSPQRIREKIEDISLRYPRVKIGLEDENVGMEGGLSDGE